MTADAFEGWALVELMGHRSRPGYAKEVEMAGGRMLRIDIPVGDDLAGDGFVTEFYGASAIYALRPASEEVVRDAARVRYGADPRPIRPVEYRERETPRLPHHDPETDDAEDDDDPAF